MDKHVEVGENAVIGFGDGHQTVNRQFPKHLYTGISLFGKRAQVPAGKKIGRNCIINSHTFTAAYPAEDILDGETLYANGEVI